MRRFVFAPFAIAFLTIQQAHALGDEFASDRGDKKPVVFDGKQAMKHLVEICKIGPRISGSKGMDKQIALLEKHFKEHGAKTFKQTFQAKQVSRKDPVKMTNLIAQWHPDRNRRVIICCHYDTRPVADEEPNPRDWTKPFVSANDGGSGVALMMELAKHVAKLKTQVGVDFVFFDGEEYVFEARRDRYFFGSEHFADLYKKRENKKTGYVAAILLDMIGGKNARFPIEQNSWWWSSALVKQVWTIAMEQKCSSFISNQFSRVPVRDDHLALNRAGIPAIDVIDFDYRHWHRLSDVPENCSADTLDQVARVLLIWLQQVR